MFRALIDRVQGLQRSIDPVFGTLAARGRDAPWEGSVHCGPTGSSVDVLLDAGPSGPTSAQRRYFSDFSDRYDGLLQAIQKLLPVDGSGYQLVCIDFQSPDPFSGRVELTYERARDGDLQSITIRGWRPELFIPE
jgi:hypothetical protein